MTLKAQYSSVLYTMNFQLLDKAVKYLLAFDTLPLLDASPLGSTCLQVGIRKRDTCTIEAVRIVGC